MGSATENMTLPSHVVAVTNGIASPLDSGHARLLELGYKQELKRDLSYRVLSFLSSILCLLVFHFQFNVIKCFTVLTF